MPFFPEAPVANLPSISTLPGGEIATIADSAILHAGHVAPSELETPALAGLTVLALYLSQSPDLAKNKKSKTLISVSILTTLAAACGGGVATAEITATPSVVVANTATPENTPTPVSPQPENTATAPATSTATTAPTPTRAPTSTEVPLWERWVGDLPSVEAPVEHGLLHIDKSTPDLVGIDGFWISPGFGLALVDIKQEGGLTYLTWGFQRPNNPGQNVFLRTTYQRCWFHYNTGSGSDRAPSLTRAEAGGLNIFSAIGLNNPPDQTGAASDDCQAVLSDLTPSPNLPDAIKLLFETGDISGFPAESVSIEGNNTIIDLTKVMAVQMVDRR